MYQGMQAKLLHTVLTSALLFLGYERLVEVIRCGWPSIWLTTCWLSRPQLALLEGSYLVLKRLDHTKLVQPWFGHAKRE